MIRVNIHNAKFLNLKHLNLKNLLDSEKVFINLEPLIQFIHFQRKLPYSDDELIEKIYQRSDMNKSNIKNGFNILKQFKLLIDSSNSKYAVEI